MPADPLTPAQRKRAERARKRRSGLVHYSALLTPAERAKVASFVRALIAQRKKV